LRFEIQKFLIDGPFIFGININNSKIFGYDYNKEEDLSSRFDGKF
jgi:hypothetical protein